MSTLVFPDTTVVRNFALLHRMDLLHELVVGRAAWCATVASECHDQARGDGLEDMALASPIFGSPWYPHDAETIVLASTRSPGAIFVTDDRSAATAATSRGLRAVKTADLLRIAIRAAKLEADAGWGYVQTLRSHGRYLSREVWSSRGSFDMWLQG